MSGQQRYDLVAQYDGLEGLVQGEGTRVVNMFRYYEEEDPRYTVYCTLHNRQLGGSRWTFILGPN